MKKIIAILVPLFILLSLPLMSYAKDTQNDQVLAVLLAKGASIQATDKANTFKLKLRGVNSKVIYFSSSPKRVSGQVTLSTFIKQWTDKNGSFAKNAPNAVMQAVKINPHMNKLADSENSYAIVLSNPVISATKGNMTFDIQSLPGNTKLMPLHESDYVAIFIDGVCLSCIGVQ